MDLNIANVISMGFPSLHFVHGVVIVHSQMHVVGASDNPLFPNDELGTSYRYFTHLETFDKSL